MKKPTEFFEAKRPWSRMKDEILGKYLVPYLSKVKMLRRLIVIVDGFAGCGKYDDGTDGSPMIISRTLQDFETNGGKAVGIYIEKDPECYTSLANMLAPFEKNNTAITIKGDFETLAKRLASLPTGLPMFLYIDPFGLKGLRFKQIEVVLRRAWIQSTEVLINFNYRALLREASAVPDLVAHVMDGKEYEKILGSNIGSDEKESRIVELYKDKLRRYFDYVGSCPVPYKDNKVKYHLIYATNHFDGLIIMNDIMYNAYTRFYTDGRLFTDLPKQDKGDIDNLKEQVLAIIRDQKIITRYEIKKILMPKLFRIHKSGDYSNVIKDLLKEERIYSENGRIVVNDNVRLSIKTFEK